MSEPCTTSGLVSISANCLCDKTSKGLLLPTIRPSQSDSPIQCIWSYHEKLDFLLYKEHS